MQSNKFVTLAAVKQRNVAYCVAISNAESTDSAHTLLAYVDLKIILVKTIFKLTLY